MVNLTYWELIKMNSFKDPKMLRVKMVKYWQEHRNISKTARYFGTSRPTVRKWVNRWQKDGWDGLEDRRNGPDEIPHKIPRELEERIVELRERTGWGPWKLKHQFDLPCSLQPIRRVLREEDMIKNRPGRWKERRNLRKKKRKLKAFELIQIDVKELKDQPDYGLLVEGGFSGIEYTARDVRTGTTFVNLARKQNVSNSKLFIQRVGKHLKKYGVDLNEVTVQTDNGAEFGLGPGKQNRNKLSVYLEEEVGFKEHRFIPPAQATFNSDVERFHGLIQDEFYTVEEFESEDELAAKLTAYLWHFNVKRKNRYRQNNWSPWEMLQNLGNYPKELMLWFPWILDDYFSSQRGGNDLPCVDTKAPRLFLLSAEIRFV